MYKQKNIAQYIECIETIFYVIRDKLNQLFFFYYLELDWDKESTKYFE